MSSICSKYHGTKASSEAMINPDTKETITGIDKALDKYKLTYGKEPLYAVCRVIFMDDYEPPHSMSFKLSMDVDKEDNEVFYYLPGVEELKPLAESSSNDFLITGFDYFINP
jgi:hypothetical protein